MQDAQETSDHVPAEPLNHLSSAEHVCQDMTVTARALLIKDRKLGLITRNWEGKPGGKNILKEKKNHLLLQKKTCSRFKVIVRL